MKKIIVILFLFIYPTNSIAHIGHYIKYNKIEMEIFRNGELIGYNHYFFNRNGAETIVTNQIKFTVKLLGATVFQIEGYSEEKYLKDQLVSYNSKTLQNDKKKFVKLNHDEKKKKFIINGSSYVGEANLDNVIGNWWNSKILEAKTQISPLSGSIKKQKSKLTNKDEIEFNGKKIKLFQFKLKSTEDLPDDKKLDFDIWLSPKEGIIFKVKYNRLGSWEYRLKSYE